MKPIISVLLVLAFVSTLSAQCVNLSNNETWGTSIANLSGFLYVNDNTSLCRDTYYINVSAPPTAALRINASNIWIDCNQSILNGVDGTGYGIYALFVTNVTIENCSMRNYQRAFLISQSNYSILRKNAAYNNTDGFYLEESNYSTLTNNTAYNNSHDGFNIISCYNSIFNINIAHNNSNAGFDLVSSFGNTLANGTSYENGYGIYAGSASYNNFIGNNLTRNHQGFEPAYSSNYNNITGNIAYNNSETGFYFYNVSYNNITNNLAYGNVMHGFVLEVNFTNNTLINNSAYGNGNDGFNVLMSCFGNIFAGSTAYSNGAAGFRLMVNSSWNSFTDTVAYDNGIYAIYIENTSTDNNFTNTFIYNQSFYLFQQATATQPNNFTNITFAYNASIGWINYMFLNVTNVTMDYFRLILDPYFVSLNDAAVQQANVSANVTIYTDDCTSPVWKDYGFPTSAAEIIADGFPYSLAHTCTGSAAPFTAVFNVTSFSGYTLGRLASSCSLSITPSSPQTYNTTVNASCSCTNPEASPTLWRNNTNVTATENNQYVTIPAGVWTYTCNVTKSENYTNASNSSLYTMNKATPSLSLTVPSGLITLGTETNVSCSVSSSQFNITLYRDGVHVDNGTLYVEDIQNLSAGTYLYVCNTSGTENYTSAAASGILRFRSTSAGGGAGAQCYLEGVVAATAPVGTDVPIQIFRYSNDDSTRTSLFGASVAIIRGGTISTYTTDTQGYVHYTPESAGTYTYAASFGECDGAEGSFIVAEAEPVVEPEGQPPVEEEQPSGEVQPGTEQPGEGTSGGTPLGCASNADCAQGQLCRNNECVPMEEPIEESTIVGGAAVEGGGSESPLDNIMNAIRNSFVLIVLVLALLLLLWFFFWKKGKPRGATSEELIGRER